MHSKHYSWSVLLSSLSLAMACAGDATPTSELSLPPDVGRGDITSDEAPRTADTSDIVGEPARLIFEAIVSPRGHEDGERAAGGMLICTETFADGQDYAYACAVGDASEGLAVEGEAAAALFDALRGGYYVDSPTRERQGWGNIFCGPISGETRYGCSLYMRTMRLDGDAAQAVYDLFAVEEEVVGRGAAVEFGTKRTEEGLRCELRTYEGGEEDYYCEIGNVLSVGGDAAREAYRALRIDEVEEGGVLVRAATSGMVCKRVTGYATPSYDCEI